LEAERSGFRRLLLFQEFCYLVGAPDALVVVPIGRATTSTSECSTVALCDPAFRLIAGVFALTLSHCPAVQFSHGGTNASTMQAAAHLKNCQNARTAHH